LVVFFRKTLKEIISKITKGNLVICNKVKYVEEAVNDERQLIYGLSGEIKALRDAIVENPFANPQKGNLSIQQEVYIEHSDGAREKTDELRRLVLGATYKHFKGDNYRVLGLAKHHESGEILVIYQMVYNYLNTYLSIATVGEIYARPIDDFLCLVERDGEVKQRFQLISELRKEET